MTKENMADNATKPNTKKKHKRRTWRIVNRAIHYYAGLLLCLPILFFAVSGFLASRPELFRPPLPNTIPKSVNLDKAELTGYLKGKLPAGAAPSGYLDEDHEIIVNFTYKSRNFTATIQKEERSIALTEVRPLPETVSLNAPETIQEAFRQEFPGKVIKDSVNDDETTYAFDMESVWGSLYVEVDKESGTCSISRYPKHWVTSFIELHRGAGNSQLQRIILEVSGLILVLTCITGIIFGFQPKKLSHRLTTASLLLGSLILFILFIINR